MYYKFTYNIKKELIVQFGVKMNNLKEYRNKKRMSLAELSACVEVSARYLRFIEKGERNPSLFLAKKIADCLNATIEELFFNEV